MTPSLRSDRERGRTAQRKPVWRPRRRPGASGPRVRTTEEVFRDHLALRKAGDVECDIERNYAMDVVLIAAFGTYEGHEGIRRCAKRLTESIGDTTFTYTTCRVHGEIAFLEWHADSSAARVTDGVDTFLIRNGRIRIKTVHYTVQAPNSSGS
jgi:hypothetical protein